MWNRNYQHCKKCLGTEKPHYARGMCKGCYDTLWALERRRNPEVRMTLRRKRMQKRQDEFKARQSRRSDMKEKLREYVRNGEHLIYTESKTILRTEKGEFYMPTPEPEVMYYQVLEFKRLLGADE
jgi:hypothetical protein